MNVNDFMSFANGHMSSLSVMEQAKSQKVLIIFKK